MILRRLFLTFLSINYLMLKEAPCETFELFLAPKQINYADYLMHFELFYKNIRNLEVSSDEDLDFVKTKTNETTLSSFRQYNKNPQQNLSKEELATLIGISKTKIL